jgi:DNA polymerase
MSVTMTAKQKTDVASFLDLSAGYLSGGYLRRREYSFTDDAPAPDTADSLAKVAGDIRVCRGCGLCERRTNTVPGEGVASPLVLVIGEGPGADEDASGRPFVGKAGQLLDKMLASIGLSRERNCFIANVVKCRPPENRNPMPEETAACGPFLTRQIALLRPRLILCAGRVAAQQVLQTEEGINRLRGRFVQNRDSIPVLPTYHPSALLHEESLKRPAFEDLKLLMARLVSLDRNYRGEVQTLLGKYAAQDEDFAATVQEYLV